MRKIVSIQEKYRKALLVFLSVYLFLGCLSIYGYLKADDEKRNTDVSPFIPSEQLFLEPMIALMIYPFTAIIGALVGGYIFSPLYLSIHKVLFRKVIYGIQESPPPEEFKTALSGWYPTLLALHISILLTSVQGLTPKIIGSEWTVDSWQMSPTIARLMAIIVLMIVILAFGVMVFSPVWFLLDSGVVYSTQKHVDGMGRPFETRAVGGWFHDYLRGYAGFGIALSFILLLVDYFASFEGGLISQLPDILWMFGLPLFLALTVIPALIVLDKIRAHRIQYVRKVASAMGIRENVLVSFEREG
jgi:hypothetical protein